MINVLFLGFFGIYLATLSGTVPAYRDSGDMINAVATLGIAHPPGYPLYIMAGKLFTFLMPFANTAYRVNVFSAFCAAGSAALLYTCGVRVDNLTYKSQILNSDPKCGASALAALGAAILYGVSPSVMSLARVSEMYALAAAVGAGIIACRIVNTPRSLLLGSFLLGCGFGVHPTLLFLAPLLVTFRKDAFLRLGFFLLGFTVVFYLMVRSGGGPVQNWGNPSTFVDLWKMITRSNYGGFKLHPVESQFTWTGASLLTQGSYFLKTFYGQWGVIGSLIGGAGLFLSLRGPTRSPWAVGLLVSGLVAGPLFFVLSNLPIERNTTGPILEPYLLLVNVLWTVWLARGLQVTGGLVRKPVFQYGIIAALVALPLSRAASSFRSYRDHFYAYDLGRNMLRTLPPRAVLYDPDDPIAFTLRSFQLLERRREDVVLLNFFRTFWGYKLLVERVPDFLPPAPVRSAQDLEALFWSEAVKRRPFYADLPVKIQPPRSYKVEGIVYPITPAAFASSIDDLARAERFFNFYSWRGAWRTPAHPDFFTRHILNYPAAAYCNLGLKYAERKAWPAAREHYLRALWIDPFLAAAYNNLGVVDYEQGHYERAAENYALAMRYDPANLGYERNFEIAKRAKSGF